MLGGFVRPAAPKRLSDRYREGKVRAISSVGRASVLHRRSQVRALYRPPTRKVRMRYYRVHDIVEVHPNLVWSIRLEEVNKTGDLIYGSGSITLNVTTKAEVERYQPGTIYEVIIQRATIPSK